MDVDRLIGLLWGVAVCAAICLFWGCRTKYVERDVPVEVRTVVRDTVWRTRHDVLCDTVFRHDSVYVNDGIKETYRTVCAVRAHLRVDTVYVTRTDSVARPVYLRETVEAVRRPRWRWIAVCAGVAAILCAVFLYVRSKVT